MPRGKGAPAGLSNGPVTWGNWGTKESKLYQKLGAVPQKTVCCRHYLHGLIGGAPAIGRITMAASYGVRIARPPWPGLKSAVPARDAIRTADQSQGSKRACRGVPVAASPQTAVCNDGVPRRFGAMPSQASPVSPATSSNPHQGPHPDRRPSMDCRRDGTWFAPPMLLPSSCLPA
jgi:hypothetical protein